MSITPRYQFAYALGYGVALASLRNVETTVGAQNRMVASGPVNPIGISSPILDPFPVRDRRLDGPWRGDGLIDHEWTMILAAYGVAWWINNVFSGGTVVSVPMTIYTLRAELNVYARYSCDATLPSPKADDLARVEGRNLFRVRTAFTDLVAL